MAARWLALVNLTGYWIKNVGVKKIIKKMHSPKEMALPLTYCRPWSYQEKENQDLHRSHIWIGAGKVLALFSSPNREFGQTVMQPRQAVNSQEASWYS